MTDDAWVHVDPAKEGWVAGCRLCGIETQREFVTQEGEDGDTARSAEQYVTEHVSSVAHKAAVDAYSRPPANMMTQEEIRVAKLLTASEHELRLFAARRAAHTSTDPD